jgi:hypothetical protein
MRILDLEVTSNYFEELGETACHIELEGCIRFVYLKDTEYNSIEELKIAIENGK